MEIEYFKRIYGLHSERNWRVHFGDARYDVLLIFRFLTDMFIKKN
jgi:hypothetical protein